MALNLGNVVVGYLGDHPEQKLSSAWRDGKIQANDFGHSELLGLCCELHRLQQQASALGLFTSERDLLACAECGLQEDVLVGGRLITYREDDTALQDSGKRFVKTSDGDFICPACGAAISGGLRE